jgi:hypothetical protein
MIWNAVIFGPRKSLFTSFCLLIYLVSRISCFIYARALLPRHHQPSGLQARRDYTYHLLTPVVIAEPSPFRPSSANN